MSKKEGPPERIMIGGEFYILEQSVKPEPREFEEEAYYPITPVLKPSATNTPDLALYREGHFYIAGEGYAYSASDFVWIGKKLEIQWPEEFG